MILKNPGPPLVSEAIGDIDLIPREYRAKIGTRRLVQQQPVDVGPSILADLLVESSVLQERTDERKKTDIELLGTPVPLIDETFLPTGQIGHRIRGLVPEGTELIGGPLLEQANQNNLGNGLLDTTHTFVDEVYPNLVSTTEVPDPLPEIFKVLIPNHVREISSAGTIDDPPTLLLGEFERREEQTTEFRKRTRTRGRGAITYPQAVTVLRHIGGDRYGGAITQLEGYLDIVEPAVEAGVGVTESEVKNLGDGSFFRQTEKLSTPYNVEWPTLIDKIFDPETRNYTIVEKQVVAPDYIPVIEDYAVENLRAIDFTHSQRIKTTKSVLNHNSPANAIVSYRYHPFQFPGTLDYNRLITYDHKEGFRKASALLAKHTVRKWYINSTDIPTVGNQDLGVFDIDVKEIISDTVNVPIYAEGNTTLAETFDAVLHDDITNTLGAFYPATTPSFTEYYLGIGSGVTGSGSLYVLTAPGTGYAAGNIITICGTPCTILATGVANSITGITQPDAPPTGVIITGLSDGGACSVSGGGGSGAAFNELVVSYEFTIPGSGWVGNERPIAANIHLTEVPNLWEVTTESVVMR